MDQGIRDYLFNINYNSDYVFSSLTKSQRNRLKESSIITEIKKGSTIFREGDIPKGLIYLTKGNAKLYKYGTGDREQIVRLVKPLSFVGYKALFAEKPHTTTAEAIEDSEIIIYSKKVLFEIIDENPKFSKEIIKALANELAFNYNRLINLTQKHIRGRLAETLLHIREIYGLEDDKKTLKARFTRENIAHFSNMTTANAIRTLKIFESENIVKIEGRKIIILDLDTIIKISKLG